MALSEEDKQEIRTMIDEDEFELCDNSFENLADRVRQYRPKASVPDIVAAAGVVPVSIGIFLFLAGLAFSAYTEATIRQSQRVTIAGEQFICGTAEDGQLICKQMRRR